MNKKILFVGHGQAGKDTACEYLEKITGLINAGTTSKYLAKYVASELNISIEEAYNRRRESEEMRIFWYEIGNKVRKDNPALLVREAFNYGDISGGVRDIEEILAVKKEKICDIIVWIENKRVKKDPTLNFNSKEADIVIENNWSLEEFYERIERLAKFANLL